MERSFRLNPEAFLEILVLGGCRLGKSSPALRYVTIPDKPGRSTVVRMNQVITNEELETHLANLMVSEADFLSWHEQYMSTLRS